ncbi:MAG: ethylbenzene dehydrogenase-related protein [Aquificaceae bacterium]
MKTLRMLALVLSIISFSFAQEIVSKRVSKVPLDPFDKVWNQATEVEVPLAGQSVTTPMQMNPTVKSIRVKSVHDEKSIAFLLVWEDPTQDNFHLIGKFSDAAAIQIPYKPSTDVPVTMGDKGQRVLILHWTAARQENIDKGYADVSKIYPNAVYDWYPHATPPYKYPEDWANQYALNYIGGEKVFRKNTLKTPVREVVAEGFGSSTWKDIQGAEGKGVYKNGKWYVVIKRAFMEENTSNPDWGPGKETFITFAVWDGSAGDVGARKALSYSWIKLKIEGR